MGRWAEGGNDRHGALKTDSTNFWNTLQDGHGDHYDYLIKQRL